MKKYTLFYGICFLCSIFVNSAFAERGAFDYERWDNVISNIRNRAQQQKISESVIDETLKTPDFIPNIIKSDRNQSEFTLTMNEYINRMVSDTRIQKGLTKKSQYPTLLNRTSAKFGVPKNVILAFWGMESNYGQNKAKYQLRDAFITLIYDGRREEFFTKQLLALMKIADKNKLKITSIHGSWAGAMGHFQFIPPTLAQYGVDGNNDGRIDIINSVGDAMYSAGNYLNKLGWKKDEKIIQRVIIPADIDRKFLNGDVKKSITEWANLGVMTTDSIQLVPNDTIVGIIADTKEIAKMDLEEKSAELDPDVDIAPKPVIYGYLTYPNFYRIKKWNNSSWYAIAIGELSEKLK